MSLEQKHILTVFRQNQAGRIYGITFVDNLNKVVFNGSDLGKGYSASGLETKILTSERIKPELDFPASERTIGKLKENLHVNLGADHSKQFSENNSLKSEQLLEHLMAPKPQHENLPFQLLKKKKRKPKNSLGL
jgi:hypothetical protein